jgi:hypothetical protein
VDLETPGLIATMMAADSMNKFSAALDESIEINDTNVLQRLNSSVGKTGTSPFRFFFSGSSSKDCELMPSISALSFSDCSNSEGSPLDIDISDLESKEDVCPRSNLEELHDGLKTLRDEDDTILMEEAGGSFSKKPGLLERAQSKLLDVMTCPCSCYPFTAHSTEEESTATSEAAKMEPLTIEIVDPRVANIRHDSTPRRVVSLITANESTDDENKVSTPTFGVTAGGDSYRITQVLLQGQLEQKGTGQD